MKALDTQFIAGEYDPFTITPFEEVVNESVQEDLLPPPKPKQRRCKARRTVAIKRPVPA